MKLAFDEYQHPHVETHNSPVIMLHGRLDSRKTWTPFCSKIAESTSRKVFALDTRNHGESPWSDEMNFDVITDDLEEFMDEHKIEKAILVGHSLGGRTAITFALRNPERVEKLIVEDMGVENYTEKAKLAVQLILNILRRSLSSIPAGADEAMARTAVHEFLKKSLPPNTTKDGGVYQLNGLPLKKEGDRFIWQANLDVLEDMLMNKTNQTLCGTYHGPSLFLYGNKSFFDVENDEQIIQHFPLAEKVCIDGAGHLIHYDYPEEFLNKLLKFISN